MNRSSKVFWAAVLLVAGAAAWPLLSGSGLLNTRGGGDSPFLLQRLHQLVTAVLDGHFPVRWMPDANYGYGYPFYNYYAPLSIYIAAVFRFLGFSFVGAIKAAQLAGFLVAGGGMFVLGRRWFQNQWAGLLAAAAYTFVPFHMVNVYVRGDSLAEFWAMAFYPLVILAADNLVQRPKRPGHIALFALAYAALVLSHNISALIFTPFLLLYLLLALLKKPNQTKPANQPINQSIKHPNTQLSITSCIIALLLALALSAWFWLPALAEQGLAQLEPVTAGYFHYSNHFRGADLVQGSLLFDYDVAGGLAFRMGLVQLVVTVVGSAVLLGRGIRRQTLNLWLVGFILIALLISTLMITPLSRPLWDNLPLLPFTQFPWRFLSVQAFFGALAAGGMALLPGRKVVVSIVVLVIVVSGLGDLRTDHLELADGDITAERLAEYEWFTGNIGSTVSAEYLPPYVQPRPFTSAWLVEGERAAALEAYPAIEAAPLSLAAGQQSWRISADDPTTAVTFPVLDWPGWEASIDGAGVDAHPAPGSGLLTVMVPSGEHTVELQLARTPVRRTAEIISVIALLAIGLLFWPAVRRRASHQNLGWAAVGIVVVVLAGIGLRLWPKPAYSADTLSWDFEQLGYLHHSPDGIPFEGNLRLRRYTYSQESAVPGEDISITLDWENATSETAELALMTPAVQRIEAAPILTVQSQPVESGPVVYRLAIPDNAPAGLYVPRLTVPGRRALTDSGQTRGDLFLRPILVFSNAHPADPGSAALDVRVVDVTYQDANVLLVQMQWLTRQPLTRNYNVSLRLVDDSGLVLAQQDGQPDFGYLPSSGWLPGRWENSWLTLPLPENFSADQLNPVPYALVARLYDVETEEVVLIRRLGQMIWQGNMLDFEEPPRLLVPTEPFVPPPATFEGLIHLESYEIEQSADFLNLTLSWHALADIQEDFSHFVHLVDPETGNIVAQHDSMPRNDTYPTSQWDRNEIVIDPVQLLLENVSPGVYLLYIGLYRNLGDTFPPLTAVDEAGQPLAGNRLFIGEVIITGNQ